MRTTLAFLAAVLCAVSCSENGGGDDDGGDSTECELGTERCGCDNGACASGLTCLSETCVRGSGGTAGEGGTSGASGSAQTGGSGQGGSTGGTSGTGGGVSGASATGGTAGTTGGASGTGGMPGGSGGSTAGSAGAGASGGGGGGGMCTANTESDPRNCGECGRVCKNLEFGNQACQRTAGDCCVDGTCGPYFSGCVTREMGLANCSQVCATLGEQCVAGGCRMATWAEYPSNDIICEELGVSNGYGTASCDTAINFEDGAGIEVRCCCTDTQR